MVEFRRQHRHFNHTGCGCKHEGFHGYHFSRRFISREEKISRLEEYLKNLQAEAKAVEEHLAELKSIA
jgi:vacuolar-type H+-ATPase subunit I/STV1